MEIGLPERRVVNLIRACDELMHKEEAQIRQVARVIGILVAATSAVVLGKLHYRRLEKAKVDALQHSHGDLDAVMSISEDLWEKASFSQKPKNVMALGQTLWSRDL
ncbi:hypothetical protein E2C01_087809 [Portunus trituberculatus]|uniref:Uncharacterized protein n=1 Tax=Portunus trituberculatus TaxID=210409 RepID=A0A5B7JKC6_PORTR|nr:hypothetical protein [Portunus trituberculatus]